MAREGFDVHHVDGDHENNLPDNLVLIEHRDHFMLHSGKRPTYLDVRTTRVVTMDAPSSIPHWWDAQPARQVAEGLTPEERRAEAFVEYENAKRVLVESLAGALCAIAADGHPIQL